MSKRCLLISRVLQFLVLVPSLLTYTSWAMEQEEKPPKNPNQENTRSPAVVIRLALVSSACASDSSPRSSRSHSPAGKHLQLSPSSSPSGRRATGSLVPSSPPRRSFSPFRSAEQDQELEETVQKELKAADQEELLRRVFAKPVPPPESSSPRSSTVAAQSPRTNKRFSPRTLILMNELLKAKATPSSPRTSKKMLESHLITIRASWEYEDYKAAQEFHQKTTEAQRQAETKARLTRSNTM